MVDDFPFIAQAVITLPKTFYRILDDKPLQRLDNIRIIFSGLINQSAAAGFK
jgi:hypothetical protein